MGTHTYLAHSWNSYALPPSCRGPVPRGRCYRGSVLPGAQGVQRCVLGYVERAREEHTLEVPSNLWGLSMHSTLMASNAGLGAGVDVCISLAFVRSAASRMHVYRSRKCEGPLRNWERRTVEDEGNRVVGDPAVVLAYPLIDLRLRVHHEGAVHAVPEGCRHSNLAKRDQDYGQDHSCREAAQTTEEPRVHRRRRELSKRVCRELAGMR